MAAANNSNDLPRVKIRKFLYEIKSSEQGLSDSEVQDRQKKHGYNEILEKKKNPLLKFLSYFWGPIPLMIEAAAILSFLIHHYTDLSIILTLLLVNVLVGFWHDHKAGNAIELLKQKLAPKARVLRNKKWCTLPARELVPGDIIRIRLGDIIPADVKLIEGDYLECDESALTGESLPVEKHIGNEAYSGSVVSRGEMTAAVTTTGVNTYFGKTAKLIEKADNKSHFEQAILKIGNYLILLAIVLIVLILFVAISRHDNLMETLRFAMVLAVASIPVALPAILTITMAIGAVSLARKKAIVSKLAAIEELAGMDVLCSDKTGTLTKNQLSVGKPAATKNYTVEDTLLYATLASREEDNDAIDNAILRNNDNDKIADRLSQFETTEFIPFDPVNKRTEVTLSDQSGSHIKVSKGAPQAIAKLCSTNHSNGDQFIEKKVDDYAKMGYRTIAVAIRNDGANWEMVGLLPLFDPPREDSADTITQAKDMGIKIKMVTGDNVSIAKQISQKLGLSTNIIRGEKINDMPQ
jgi:H+-transporting ATPase